jgi:hypothetical protein
MGKQLECRIVIRYHGSTFSMGMADPLNDRYEPLGSHPYRDIDRVVGGLKERILREGHKLTFSEMRGPR